MSIELAVIIALLFALFIFGIRTPAARRPEPARLTSIERLALVELISQEVARCSAAYCINSPAAASDMAAITGYKALRDKVQRL